MIVLLQWRKRMTDNLTHYRAVLFSVVLLSLLTNGTQAAQMSALPTEPVQRELPTFLTGGDISLLAREEQLGQVYKDHGKTQDALAIFKAHGSNCMRLRLWVHPNGADIYVNDLAYTTALGKRIKQAGLYLMLDIHYSDTWADPAKQTMPAEWENLSFDALTKKVHDYTQDVIETMRRGGAMPDMVQVGNEVIGGMLWPIGKNWGPGNDYTKFCTLLKAGVAGVKDGAKPLSSPLIMIHIDRGGDWEATKSFFDTIQAQGVSFDVIGESYYPFFHGPLSQLKTTLDNAAARYHKPIIVAETGYPYREDGRKDAVAVPYPRTPEGQYQFLHDLAATVHSVPNGLGRGVIYWAPEWIPVKGLKGSWNGTTLFDDTGNALPGISALWQGFGLDKPQ